MSRWWWWIMTALLSAASWLRNIDACREARVIGYAADLNEARHAMNSHKCYAILEIPEGFGKKSEEANRQTPPCIAR